MNRIYRSRDLFGTTGLSQEEWSQVLADKGTRQSRLFLHKEQWSGFSDQELDHYVDALFAYYREEGFPYFPADEAWRMRKYRELEAFDYRQCIDQSNRAITQSMHGLALSWSYHPYHYTIPCNGKRTVMEVFDDDDLLKAVIRKRLSMGDNMSDNELRKMLKVFTGTQCVSNFRPTAAAAIYEQFSAPGDSVWDMSFGFGGRLLGANLAGRNYVGTDPSVRAFKGVTTMASELGLDGSLILSGSERRVPITTNSIDLCFTSPPYFDTEQYCTDASQSYIKYPDKENWLLGFLGGTLRNCRRVLVPDGKLIVNIANVPSYPNLVDDTVLTAIDNNFELVDRWELRLSSLAGREFKAEPLLVFQCTGGSRR